MVVSIFAVAGMSWAQEAEASTTINPTPDDTWMTNGTVYSVIRHGDYIYVGGKFGKVLSSPTGASFAARNLARFHADTGLGDPDWTPDVTGADMTKTQVYELAAAGENIWVGGTFGAVDGVARRNLAAVNASTGTVDQNVDPLVGPSETAGGVRAMAVSDTKVYVGGGFSGIDGKGRKNLAAFDFSGNLDAKWRPKTDKVVRGLDFSCDGTTIFATGSFRNAAGPDGVYAPREQVARFDTAYSSLHPWAIPAGKVGSEEVGSDLAVTCERVTVPFLGPNHLRSFRLDDGNMGTVAWDIKSGGDPQTVAMLGDDKLIVGGHFGQVQGGKRARIAQLNLSDGSLDPWNPGITGKDGAATIGPWDLLVDGNHLYIGGGFWEVAGLERTFLTRFTTSLPPASDTTPPETTIDSGPQDPAGGSAQFVFSSSESGSTFECSLDGEAFSSCTSPKDYTDLAEGEHTFEVKATDSANNADTTPASHTWTVVDATAPTVQPSAQSLVLSSTLGTNTVPVKLTWSATDDSGTISEYKLQQSTNGGDFTNVSISKTATSRILQLAPGNTYQFRVQAKDQAGNWSDWANGAKFTVSDHQESSSALTYAGTWTAETLSSAYGGSLNYAGSNGAKAQFSFTGSSVSWVAPKNADRGKATVWIDGVKDSTIDLYSSSDQPRKVVFVKNDLDASQAHTLEVQVLGNKNAASNGTRVDVDAFTVLSSP
jgi:hypothetical protein